MPDFSVRIVHACSMKKRLHRLVATGLFISIITVCTSCVKDIDLDQAEEFELYTSQDIDLIHFSIAQNTFVNENTGNLETAFFSEKSVIDFFDEDFFQSNLKEIRFLFGAENTFSQSFFCRIRFLDPQDQQLYAVDFSIEGSVDGSTVLTEKEVLIKDSDLELLKSGPFNKIELSVELIDNGLPVEGSLDFKSTALYTLKLP